MYRESRFYYTILACAALASLVLFLIEAVACTFVPAYRGLLLGLPVFVGIAALIAMFLRLSPKVPQPLSHLAAFFLPAIGVLLHKWLASYFPTHPTLSWGWSAGIAVAVGVIVFYCSLRLSERFLWVYQLLEREEEMDRDDYIHWLNGEIGDNGKKIEAKWVVERMSNSGFLMLLIGILALVRVPESKSILSLYLVIFALASAGMYLIARQFETFIHWSLFGHRIKREVVRNWNGMLRTIVVLTLIAGILVPWNYQIVKLPAVTDFINRQLLAVNVNLGLDEAGIARSLSNEMQTAPVSGTRPAGTGMAKWAFFGLGVFAAVYLLLALIGYFVFRHYKTTFVHGWPKFFINRYITVTSILSLFWEALTAFGRLFVPKKKKKPEEDRDKKLKQHLSSYFNLSEALPDGKREEILWIIREFVRFIDECNRLVTPYFYYLGPSEYTQKVKGLLPALSADLGKIVDVFNESRYSLHLLDQKTKDDFSAAVNRTINAIERKNTPEQVSENPSTHPQGEKIS